jgi:hypothetical protein
LLSIAALLFAASSVIASCTGNLAVCPPDCNGCCDATGACQSGKTNDACGVGGQLCAVCDSSKGSCNAGSCGGTGIIEPGGMDAGNNPNCGNVGQACCVGTCYGGGCCDPSTTMCITPGGRCTNRAICAGGTCGGVVTMDSGPPPLPGTMLASGEQHPIGIATDGAGNIFWVDQQGGTLRTCNTTHCTPTTLMSGQSSPEGLVYDQSSATLYWNNTGGGAAGGIWKCMPPDCAGSAAQIVTDTSVESGAGGIASYQDLVYWTDYNNAQVDFCVGSNCNANVVANGQSNANAVAIDPNQSLVFWTDLNAGVFSCQFGSTCVGSQTTVWSGSVGMGSGIAVDGNGFVYFGMASQLVQCPTTGQCVTPTTLASAIVTDVVVDGTNVYFTDFANVVASAGRILRCSVNGCGNNPTVIATMQSGPGRLTVDGANVYWTDFVSGQIWMAPK